MRATSLLSTIALAIALIAAAPPARAQGIPPDVQAILDKAKTREPLTAADIARLKQWQQDMASAARGGPGKQAAPAQPPAGAIPVRIWLDVSYDEDYDGYVGSHVAVHGWSDGFSAGRRGRRGRSTRSARIRSRRWRRSRAAGRTFTSRRTARATASGR
jgi:hypothetical protein